MILVDTSVWVDHLHDADATLVTFLGDDEVGCHPYVIEELALGSIRDRDTMLDLLTSLRQFPVLAHTEMRALVDARRLWGRGLSPVDAHLLGSVRLSGSGRLWTRDKRLKRACQDVGVSYVDES